MGKLTSEAMITALADLAQNAQRNSGLVLGVIGSNKFRFWKGLNLTSAFCARSAEPNPQPCQKQLAKSSLVARRANLWKIDCFSMIVL